MKNEKAKKEAVNAIRTIIEAAKKLAEAQEAYNPLPKRYRTGKSPENGKGVVACADI